MHPFTTEPVKRILSILLVIIFMSCSGREWPTEAGPPPEKDLGEKDLCNTEQEDLKETRDQFCED